MLRQSTPNCLSQHQFSLYSKVCELGGSENVFFATNTLEHFAEVSMTGEESFIALTPKNTFLAADFYRLRDTSLLKKKKFKA